MDKHRDRLASQLLNSTPHVAMIISSDRVVVEVNELAREAGITPGTRCWDSFGGRVSITNKDRATLDVGGCEEGIRCTFCMANSALGDDEEKIEIVDVAGARWETHWNPVGNEQFLHYGVEIEQSKKKV